MRFLLHKPLLSKELTHKSIEINGKLEKKLKLIEEIMRSSEALDKAIEGDDEDIVSEVIKRGAKPTIHTWKYLDYAKNPAIYNIVMEKLGNEVDQEYEHYQRMGNTWTP